MNRYRYPYGRHTAPGSHPTIVLLRSRIAAPYLSVLALLSMLSPAAHAQSFNIDFGNIFTVPSATFGGAANQVGAWNKINTFGNPVTLNNLAGTPTAVTLLLTANSVGGNAFSGGTDTRTMKDDHFFSSVGNVWSFSVNGLTNGVYDMYAYGPTSANTSTRLFTANGVAGPNVPGDKANNDALVLGVDYAIVGSVTVTNGTLVVTSSNANGVGGLSGLQIVPQQSGSAAPEPSTLLLFSAILPLLTRALVRRHPAA
jgi:hypothetical protein